MALQDLQEMRAGAGFVLFSGFIHFTVLAEKSAANVHIMKNFAAHSSCYLPRVFHFETKFCLRFYRNFGLQVVVKSPQLFASVPWRVPAFLSADVYTRLPTVSRAQALRFKKLLQGGKATLGEVGVIKLTANRRQFSPINLN